MYFMFACYFENTMSDACYKSLVFSLWKSYIHLNPLIRCTAHASSKVNQSALSHLTTFLADPIWWACLKKPPHILANCIVFVATIQIFFFTFKIIGKGLVMPCDLFCHLPWCFLGHTCKLANIHWKKVIVCQETFVRRYLRASLWDHTRRRSQDF